MLALTDEKGRDSVVMGAGDDGKSTIGMMAANNKPRVAINYTPGRGPGLALFDDDNVGKAGLAIIHGKPVIGLNKADGTPAIAMSYDPKREAALLGFLNSRNEAKAGFGLMNDKPLLFAYRPDDTGLLFNIQRDGRPALGLLTEGRPEWSATGTVPQMPALDGILDQVLR
ncbi:hypothetical protein FAK_36560 [Desulfoferula mesophila]|uniref:Uncharacterized protein n=2 Tax=Desulfoferula mesophila TaxID=3058419 RepID=A0AAU9EIL1_9BACT|nr:hypothetical protein FAK_36560 [Desulfoferula mesophilus]